MRLPLGLIACVALAALAIGPGEAQERRRGGGGAERPDGPPGEGGPRRRRYVDPSAVLATEIAFARLAQQKGQWTAFRKTADPEAEMFAPQRTPAAAWLKGRKDPAVSVRWNAHAVWASCDGSIAVTTGEWQRPAAEGSSSTGAYATVWRRQEKGDYRWLLDMSLASDQPLTAPEMIPALIADCEGPRIEASAAPPLQAGDDSRTTVSRDGSLRWTSTVRADGSRRFVLAMRQDGKEKQVLDLSSAAPGP